MREHNPYAEWIFSEETLSAQQTQTLQSHLSTCADCRRLADQWRQTQSLLAATPLAEPRTGFVGRWKAQTGSRQRQSNFWRSWNLVAATGMGGVLLVLGGFLASGLSVGQLLAAGQETASSAFANIEEAIQTWNFSALFFGGPIPFYDWIIGGGVVLALSALWFILLRYISSRNDQL
jgi:hypothetical protein